MKKIINFLFIAVILFTTGISFLAVSRTYNTNRIVAIEDQVKSDPVSNPKLNYSELDFESLKQLAGQGDSEAQREMGLTYYYSRHNVPEDESKAIKWFTLSAEQGDRESQYRLGDIYYKGSENVRPKFQEAVKWFTLSGKQGDNYSQHNLGRMYEKGEGVPKDYEESISWYQLSAEQGNATAQYDLGVLYATRKLSEDDFISSYKWINLARTLDQYYYLNDESNKFFKNLEKQLTLELIIEGQKLSREWLEAFKAKK